MAKLKILKDPVTGESFYPYTHEKAITDDNGNEVIAAIKSDITANTTNINKNKTDIAANTSNITKNANDIKTLKSDLDDETTRATNRENEIESLFTMPTQEAVNKWLNDHPEATTTVQDGSLTIKKIKVGELGYVTPQMFGAKGDGITDDTIYINEAINFSYINGIDVYIPNGTYIINATSENNMDGGILCKDNTHLVLDNNTILKCKPNDSALYQIINIKECNNVIIEGGHIIGDVNEHLGSTGEHGMGINIVSSTNVIIRDVEVSYCWGDCIYIGCLSKIGVETGSNYSKNVTLENVHCHHSRRDGCGSSGCDGLVYRHVIVHDVIGTAPQSGIDIETNNNKYPNKNIILDDVTIYGCGSLGFVTGAATENIEVKNSNIDVFQIQYFTNGSVENSKIGDLYVYNMNEENITFSKCSINCISISQQAIYNVNFYRCIIGGTNKTVLSVNLGSGGENYRVCANIENCNILVGTDGFSQFNARLKALTIKNCNIFNGGNKFCDFVSRDFLDFSFNTISGYAGISLVTDNAIIINNIINTNNHIGDDYGLIRIMKSVNSLSVNVCNNIVVGQAKNRVFIRSDYGDNPKGNIIGNIIPQYSSIGVFDSDSQFKNIYNVISTSN